NSAFIAMVPTFGRAPKLSTNPISFAAPAGRHAPFVLDMATTTVAFGKLRIASRWGKPIPSGWALDDDGEPTTDPDVAMKHRLQTPLGGTRELGSHKGYGLAVMVDILSGILPGAVYGDLFQRTDRAQRKLQDTGHCFFAIDPARFRPLADFKRDMDDFFDSLKSTPPAVRARVASPPPRMAASSIGKCAKSRCAARATATITSVNLAASMRPAPDCSTRSSGPSWVTL